MVRQTTCSDHKGCPIVRVRDCLLELKQLSRTSCDRVNRPVRKEGVDLAYLASLIAKRLQSASPDKDWVPSVAFAGSILEKVPPVREALVDALHQEFPTLIALPGVVDPIAGALWRARTATP